MNTASQKTNELLDVIVSGFCRLTERRIWENVGEISHAIYEIACKIGKTDAFYCCLYNERRQQLAFILNIDNEMEEAVDKADLYQLGDGPASWVIKNRQTFTLNQDTINIQRGGKTFGSKRPSNSAIHAPMFVANANNQQLLLGVISIQSYDSGIYDQNVVKAFEFLANTAGMCFYNLTKHTDLEDMLLDARTWQDEFTGKVNTVLNQIVRKLHMINKQLSAIPGTHEVSKALNDIRKYAMNQQAENLLPNQNKGAAKNKFLSLSPIEQQILKALDSSPTDKEISKERGIAVSTVKKHISSIRQKLELKNYSRTYLINMAREYVASER